MESGDTLGVLTEVLHGAQMGIAAIDEVLKKCENQPIEKHLLKTQNDYKELEQRLDKEIQDMGGVPHEINVWNKVSAWAMANMETIAGDTAKQIAKMMLEGMDMAQKKMEETRKNHPKASTKAMEYCDELLDWQEEQRPVYEAYLS